MIVAFIIIAILRSEPKSGAGAIVMAEVKARQGGCMHRSAHLLSDVTKGSTLSGGSIPSYLLIEPLKADHFRQDCLRVLEFPIRTTGCTSIRSTRVGRRGRILNIGIVAASAAPICPIGTTFSYLPCRPHCVQSITSGFW